MDLSKLKFKTDVERWMKDNEEMISAAQLTLLDSAPRRPRSFFTIGRDSLPFVIYHPEDYPKNKYKDKFFFSSKATPLADWIETVNGFAESNVDVKVGPLFDFAAKQFAMQDFFMPENTIADRKQSLKASRKITDFKREEGSSPETQKALYSEYKALKKGKSAELKFSVHLVDDNLFHWNVSLTGFDPETVLGRDLVLYEERFGSCEVQLDLQFPESFPVDPPFVRVVRPRFVHLSGNVLSGGSLCLEFLGPTWDPAIGPADIILRIRRSLVETGARVDSEARMEYNEAEGKAALTRMRNLRQSGILKTGGYEKRLEVFPPVYAEAWSLEASGSILLPFSELDAIARAKISHPVTVELKTPKGEKCYASVWDFWTGSYAIAPYWMMKALRISEGTPCRIKVVDMPAAEKIVLQPHSAEGISKEFLVSGLRKLGVVEKGSTVTMSDREGNKHQLNVIDTAPSDVCKLVSRPDGGGLAIALMPPIKLSEKELSAEIQSAAEDRKKDEEVKLKRPAPPIVQKRKDMLRSSGRKVLQIDVRNCWLCDKKLRVMEGIKCRCGYTFCGRHRYPSQHACTFDFATADDGGPDEAVSSHRGMRDRV